MRHCSVKVQVWNYHTRNLADAPCAASLTWCTRAVHYAFGWGMSDCRVCRHHRRDRNTQAAAAVAAALPLALQREDRHQQRQAPEGY
jgi:hypothetical protein